MKKWREISTSFSLVSGRLPVSFLPLLVASPGFQDFLRLVVSQILFCLVDSLLLLLDQAPGLPLLPLLVEVVVEGHIFSPHSVKYTHFIVFF